MGSVDYYRIATMQVVSKLCDVYMMRYISVKYIIGDMKLLYKGAVHDSTGVHSKWGIRCNPTMCPTS